MKNRIVSALIGLGMILGSPAHAYNDCWTAYFDSSQFSITYDDTGVRYVGGLPAGVTCGCSVSTSTIWVSGVAGQKKGTTAAVLAASLAGKRVRFYLREENSDGYCRSSIVEVKPD